MLIVELWVNSSFIGKETAQRISGTASPDSINTYKLSDGRFITHRYGDGAARLAEQMMRHLAEIEETRTQ